MYCKLNKYMLKIKKKDIFYQIITCIPQEKYLISHYYFQLTDLDTMKYIVN